MCVCVCVGGGGGYNTACLLAGEWRVAIFDKFV